MGWFLQRTFDQFCPVLLAHHAPINWFRAVFFDILVNSQPAQDAGRVGRNLDSCSRLDLHRVQLTV